MKYPVVCLFLLSLLISRCKHNDKSGGVNEADSTRFFQVTRFIKNDIDEVNKTPYFIFKVEVQNGKTDSTAINTATFNRLSAPFLKPDLNEEDLKPKYKESIFEDQTTKSFTISYSSLDKQLEIQNVEVLLKDDGETVKRIFVRKFFNYPDSSAIEQLSWKPGESFQINRSVQKKDGSESNRQTTVVWNQKN
jgi:hypothetical protein